MRLSIKTFRPGWVPTLVVLALLALLIGLGVWQWGRGVDKRELLAVYTARSEALPLTAVALQAVADPAFRAVRLRGHFDADHSVLLDNSVRDGSAGVELLQPFEDQVSGLWWLVNRGWLPWPDRRTPPVFSTPRQTLEVEATVYVPGATFQLHADPAGGDWPRLLTAVSAAALWPALGREGYGFEVRMRDGPGAYRLGWPAVAMGPEKHFGYAVQWFAMAAALTLLYLYFGWHNPIKEAGHGRRPGTTPKRASRS